MHPPVASMVWDGWVTSSNPPWSRLPGPRLATEPSERRKEELVRRARGSVEWAASAGAVTRSTCRPAPPPRARCTSPSCSPTCSASGAPGLHLTCVHADFSEPSLKVRVILLRTSMSAVDRVNRVRPVMSWSKWSQDRSKL